MRHQHKYSQTPKTRLALCYPALQQALCPSNTTTAQNLKSYSSSSDYMAFSLDFYKSMGKIMLVLPLLYGLQQPPLVPSFKMISGHFVSLFPCLLRQRWCWVGKLRMTLTFQGTGDDADSTHCPLPLKGLLGVVHWGPVGHQKLFLACLVRGGGLFKGTHWISTVNPRQILGRNFKTA